MLDADPNQPAVALLCVLLVQSGRAADHGHVGIRAAAPRDAVAVRKVGCVEAEVIERESQRCAGQVLQVPRVVERGVPSVGAQIALSVDPPEAVLVREARCIAAVDAAVEPERDRREMSVEVVQLEVLRAPVAAEQPEAPALLPDQRRGPRDVPEAEPVVLVPNTTPGPPRAVGS